MQSTLNTTTTLPARRRLARARVVVFHGSPATGSLVRSLVEQGVGHVRVVGGDGADETDRVAWPETDDAVRVCVDRADLVVATVGGPILFYDWLARLNRICHERALDWMRVSVPSMDEIHLGPLVSAESTACHACFELRYKSNLGHLDDYLPFEGDQRGLRWGVDFGVPPPMFELCGVLGAGEAVRFLVDPKSPEIRGRLVVVDPHRPGISRHAVLPLPRCEVCSPPREMEVTP